jgi:hypothetical protein
MGFFSDPEKVVTDPQHCTKVGFFLMIGRIMNPKKQPKKKKTKYRTNNTARFIKKLLNYCYNKLAKYNDEKLQITCEMAQESSSSSPSCGSTSPSRPFSAIVEQFLQFIAHVTHVTHV